MKTSNHDNSVVEHTKMTWKYDKIAQENDMSTKIAKDKMAYSHVRFVLTTMAIQVTAIK